MLRTASACFSISADFSSILRVFSACSELPDPAEGELLGILHAEASGSARARRDSTSHFGERRTRLPSMETSRVRPAFLPDYDLRSIACAQSSTSALPRSAVV